MDTIKILFLRSIDQRGEKLGVGSHLIKSRISSDAFTYDRLRAAYARALERARLEDRSRNYYVLHMHTLRKWFRTQLESVMTGSFIERLLGHVSTEYPDDRSIARDNESIDLSLTDWNSRQT